MLLHASEERVAHFSKTYFLISSLLSCFGCVSVNLQWEEVRTEMYLISDHLHQKSNQLCPEVFIKYSVSISTAAPSMISLLLSCVYQSFTCLIPTCQWVTLLHWVTCSYYYYQHTHTLVYFPSAAHTHTEHQMWIHLLLKLVSNKSYSEQLF